MRPEDEEGRAADRWCLPGLVWAEGCGEHAQARHMGACWHPTALLGSASSELSGHTQAPGPRLGPPGAGLLSPQPRWAHTPMASLCPWTQSRLQASQGPGPGGRVMRVPGPSHTPASCRHHCCSLPRKMSESLVLQPQTKLILHMQTLPHEPTGRPGHCPLLAWFPSRRHCPVWSSGVRALTTVTLGESPPMRGTGPLGYSRGRLGAPREREV